MAWYTALWTSDASSTLQVEVYDSTHRSVMFRALLERVKELLQDLVLKTI